MPTVLEDGKEAKGNDNFALQDDNLDDDEEEAEEESQQESENETVAVAVVHAAFSLNCNDESFVAL